MERLFGKTVTMLSSLLDYRAARHTVIASNIANIGTPAYRPKDIQFSDVMTSAMEEQNARMKRTDERHLALEGGHSIADYEVVTVGDKVDMDSEMAKIAENNLGYNLAAELMARKLRGLKNILKEVR